jgi:hypothetical protein
MNQVSVFRLAQIRLPVEKNRFLLMFAGINFIATGLDVTLAHSINSFIPVYELIPVYVSPLCALSCILLSFQAKPRGWLAGVHMVMMAAGFAVGAIGTAFHGNAVLNPGVADSRAACLLRDLADRAVRGDTGGGRPGRCP